jgi:hypothetical protein
MVIHHSGISWRFCGCILGDGTYTFCQLSYDVGHGLPLRPKSVRGASGGFYPVCRIKKASFSHPESLRKPSGRTRKLYPNALYGWVWPEENQPLAAARRVGARPGRLGNRRPVGPAERSKAASDRLGDADGRPPSRADPSLRAGFRRPGSRHLRRSTCGASRLDGKPPGRRPRCTSRGQTPPGRSGSRRSPFRT